MAQLKNAWTEFTTGIMNSDLVKNGVSFLTSILNSLNKITSGISGLGGETNKALSSFTKIGVALAIFQTI
jgi:hypothetical protein